MERHWKDVRDGREWHVVGVYVMPRRNPGERIAMMGPETPIRLMFRHGQEHHEVVVRLDQPLEELSDVAMASVLDQARES